MLLAFFVLVLAVLVAVSLTTVIQRRSCVQSGQKIVFGSYSQSGSFFGENHFTWHGHGKRLQNVCPNSFCKPAAPYSVLYHNSLILAHQGVGMHMFLNKYSYPMQKTKHIPYLRLRLWLCLAGLAFLRLSCGQNPSSICSAWPNVAQQFLLLTRYSLQAPYVANRTSMSRFGPCVLHQPQVCADKPAE